MTKAHFQHESNCGIRSLLFSEDSLTPTQERLEDLRSEMKKLGVEAHWELVIDNWQHARKNSSSLFY